MKTKNQTLTVIKIIGLLLWLPLGASCQNSQELALKGMSALQEGKKVTALRFFEEALRKNKNNPLSLYGKGKILLDSMYTFHLGQEMIEKSLPDLNAPYRADAYLDLADSYAKSNQYSESIQVLDNAKAENLQSEKFCYKHIFYLMQMRQYNKAKSKSSLCMDSYPQDIPIRILSATLEAKRYNYKESIKILEEAHQIAPENREVVKKTAIVYYIKKDYDKSVNELKKLIGLQTDPSQITKIKSWIKQVKQKRWNVTL